MEIDLSLYILIISTVIVSPHISAEKAGVFKLGKT